MTTETPIGWIAVVAIIVGACVRTLKTDGMKTVLAFFGLPPIPTRALPWIALVLGGVAAVLDARVEGASWDAAAQAGVLSAAIAVFGHELLSGVPGVKRLLVVAFVVLGPTTLVGCAWLEKRGPTLMELLAEKTKCALENMNLPNEEILKRCAIQPGDAERVLELVGKAREEAAREAAAARADERAKLSAAAGACAPDAGAGDAGE
jgi:hypothetical protein